MDWVELFEEAGLTDREARSLVLLSSSKELKASDLAKKLGTNRLDAYNSCLLYTSPSPRDFG